MNKNLRYSLLKMLFNRKFLKELQKILNGSNLYPRTKYTVNCLLKTKEEHQENKYLIFDAIGYDTSRNNDPSSLKKLWDTKVADPTLNFLTLKKN